MPVEIAHQIGQPAALGVHRRMVRKFTELCPQGGVGGQLLRVLLGKPAWEHHRGAVRGEGVGEWIERNRLPAGGVHQFVSLGVAEGERRPAATATTGLPPPARRPRQRVTTAPRSPSIPPGPPPR